MQYSVKQNTITIYTKLIQKTKKNLNNFLENYLFLNNNRKKLNTSRHLKQKLQYKNKEKFKFLSKKYIREMQYISLTAATKLNSICTIFYYIS